MNIRLPRPMSLKEKLILEFLTMVVTLLTNPPSPPLSAILFGWPLMVPNPDLKL